MNQMSHFFGSVAISQVFYCSGAVCNCCHHFVSMCDGGSCEIFVVEMYCVCETFVVGVFYVASMYLVVFWWCLQVPFIDSVVCPCDSFVCLFMYLYWYARGAIPAKVGFLVGLRTFSYVPTPSKLTNAISITQFSGPKKGVFLPTIPRKCPFFCYWRVLAVLAV